MLTALPSALRPLRVLLPTLGSAGDVHPMLALGLHFAPASTG